MSFAPSRQLGFLELKRDGVRFVEELLIEADRIDLSLEDFEMDHICYRVSSLDQYSRICNILLEGSQRLIEAPVNGRLITTFKLTLPIKAAGREIFVIEVPQPKPGVPYDDGFEHAEFVVNIPLAELMRQYSEVTFDTSACAKPTNPEVRILLSSGKSLKFHNMSLEHIIKKEIASQL
ncbi:MAG: VOC family protein [Chitinophagaceae bacterium]|nr:VOC family protein [Oligoflexus sp.]